MGKVIECSDYKHLSLSAFEILNKGILEGLKIKDFYTIALPGGRSPRGLFDLLKDAEIPWHRIKLYFTDERCLSPASTESNYNLVHRLLLRYINIPVKNIFRIKGEAVPEEAARDYDLILKDTLDYPGFDLLILGLGNDCHIASLFPHSASLKEKTRLALPVFNTPVAPRVTITPPVIKASRKVVLLVPGREKEKAFKKLIDAKTTTADCPGKLAYHHPNSIILYEFQTAI